MSDLVKENVRMHAVCVMGLVTGDADTIAFKTDAAHRYPVILFAHEDEEKVRRMARRIATKLAKVTAFMREDCHTSQAVISVLEINAALSRRTPDNGSAATPTAPRPRRQRRRDGAAE